MGLFDNEEDHTQNQIDEHTAQLKFYENKLAEIEGVDTPEVNQHREELAHSMHNVQLSLDQALDQKKAEQEQAEGKEQGLDFFHD